MSDQPGPSPFERLLPRDAVVITASPAMWDGGLHADEATAVARAVEKRRREFTAGRNAARSALQTLGVTVVSIPVGTQREPVLPAGLSLSITHCDDYCAAAAIRVGAIASLGIDAERNVALPAEIRAQVVASGEAEKLSADLVSENGIGCDPLRLAFSAKEAFYKAWFPQARRFLDFLGARITIDPGSASFTIRVVDPAAPTAFRDGAFVGRYAIDEARLYTAIALPPLGRSANPRNRTGS